MAGHKRKRRSPAGLKAVAIFEGSKGAVVLLTGLGLMALIHKDVHAFAEQLVRHLSLNPASHYPRIFVDAADKVTDLQLWLLSLSAFLYSVMRFIEAFGLWKGKGWAEWFAVLSGGMYLPVELFEVIRRMTYVKLIIATSNVVIVIYLAYLLVQGRHKGRHRLKKPFAPT